MIDFSTSPDPSVKDRNQPSERRLILKALNSLTGLPLSYDGSGGRLKAALVSQRGLLSVTSMRYSGGNGTIVCLNVRVIDQDYRLILGYDGVVVKADRIDSAAANEQTRKDAERYAVLAAPTAGVHAKIPDFSNPIYGNSPVRGDVIYGNSPFQEAVYGNIPSFGGGSSGRNS